MTTPKRKISDEDQLAALASQYVDASDPDAMLDFVQANAVIDGATPEELAVGAYLERRYPAELAAALARQKAQREVYLRWAWARQHPGEPYPPDVPSD